MTGQDCLALGMGPFPLDAYGHPSHTQKWILLAKTPGHRAQVGGWAAYRPATLEISGRLRSGSCI